jgi:Transposase DNA-binding/Transposase Tn5 dimerisation domain
MSYLVLDVAEWAEKQFGSCRLGNLLRSRRAVKAAMQFALSPDASTPDQIECWSDLKATYDLFDRDRVTFTALAEPHWLQTRSMATGTCLLINDTTETDFGIHRQVKGLGPTGDGDGRGFMLHSSLMVNANTCEVIGLAGQELFYRQPRKNPNENSYQRTQRARESEVWGRVIDLVGKPATGVKYLHVCDRGADNMEVFCHCQQQQCGWVIRATQLKRRGETPDGRRVNLINWLAAQPVLGTYELMVRETKTQKARKARMEIRVAPFVLTMPKRKTPYLKKIGSRRIAEWVVEAREIDPPKGTTPVQWVLHTSEPVATFEQAWQILEYYEARWLIEEFHKCLKTGCRLESRLYGTAKRLEALSGILSVLAVRLLQMKSVAKQQPELPAERVVPKAWLDMLRALRQRPIRTIRDFFRHLAGLGGYLMRKGDGEPGWITLWRGLEKLLLCVRGARAIERKLR